MPLKILPAIEQTPGGFDNGRITERRPVLFANRGAETARIGSLFYWAWAVADNGGFIAEHHHQGFEIVSVVLEGTIEHRDSLGTWKALHTGDVQVMQTNSGVSHSERFVEGVHTELFQIWFEPNLRETLTLPPTYTDLPASLFEWSAAGGNKIKKMLSPENLRTNAHLHEIALKPNGSMKFEKDNTHAVVVAISGDATITLGEESGVLHRGDAAMATLGNGEVLRVKAGDADFRYAQVAVPVDPGYELYPNI